MGFGAGAGATTFFTGALVLVLLALELAVRQTVTDVFEVLAPTFTLPLLLVAVHAASAGDAEIKFEKSSSRTKSFFTP